MGGTLKKNYTDPNLNIKHNQKFSKASFKTRRRIHGEKS